MVIMARIILFVNLMAMQMEFFVIFAKWTSMQ